MNSMKKEVKKILKHYWKRQLELTNEYYKELAKLEKYMNTNLKKYKLPELIFFPVDGELVGIGATYYEDRKKFKLIQGEDLYE